MNCLINEEQLEQKEIERVLKELNKQYKKDIKLLLLGTGESGKSTFIRQMRILYDNGFSDEERLHHIKLIYENIFSSMKNMIAAMELLKIDYEKSENATENALLINKVSFNCDTDLKEPYLSAIKQLWNDKGIQKCYLRRNEYQLNDSTKYYLDDIDRIALPDYVPTNQDILRVRQATTGLIDYNFQVKNVKFRITDVGGQRSERRKWMHCFDNVKAILFLVAISEYDQVLKEDEHRNRLKESFKVFESVSNFFQGISIILFLNKIDLFAEKIMYSHLDEFFPEFKGPRCDYEAASKFILDMFLQARPNMYHRYTCATDTQNIEMVFTAVKDIILNTNLDKFGLM
ncbi:guanine nucleotide-binding protein subunit alpha-11-like [Lucilia sericata]|uniref:guanine nucleotide-binding protein subunit alpha-11-like n=1 Tax=Lucilia sericata TaxID=13632 RepID=UPI0018A87BAC|nr:guanine nucleotide-binding protein subunit alpha-11-like [Lucilia sericata]XP_037827227.1 guanine nucleotide-binding protein subunit alpha-11-like [Lucilia sericata]